MKNSLSFRVTQNGIHYDYTRFVTQKLCHGGKHQKMYTDEGLVPKEIAVRGVRAIKRWIKNVPGKKIRNEIEKDLEIDHKTKQTSIKVDATYGCVTLEGNFCWSEDKGNWIVMIQSPVKKSWDFCWGGHATPFGADFYELFDEHALLSSRAKKQVERMLKEMYYDWINRRKIHLVDQLNTKKGKL